MSVWTLNDNPRVTAERRLVSMRARRDMILRSKAQWRLVRGEDGAVESMAWHTGHSPQRVRELLSRVDPEIRRLEKFIASFK